MSQQINLLSPLLLKKRYAFGLREMGLALGLVLAGVLAWSGFLHYQAGVLETEATQREALQAKAQQELDQLTAAATRPVSALLTERIKSAQVQVAQREALLGVIGGTIKSTASGFSPRLRALAHSGTEGVWLNAFTLAPGYVALKGAAMNAGLITIYMDQLGKHPPFSGMRFSGMDAVLAQSKGDSETKTAALPDHINFNLYSGSSENLTEQGATRGQ